MEATDVVTDAGADDEHADVSGGTDTDWQQRGAALQRYLVIVAAVVTLPIVVFVLLRTRGRSY